jgi:hypothetical protein
MLIHFKIYLIISTISIIISLSSCGYENDKEPVLEISKIKKVFVQETLKTTREVFTPPILSMIESQSLNENNLPTFGFRSSKAGTIIYIGSCFGSSLNAIRGDNHILLGTMVEGAYADCSIQVIDSEGNISGPLQVPSFTVDFSAPKLFQVGDIRVQGRKVKIVIKASEIGNLAFSGNCSGKLFYIKQGVSEVTISFPGDGQYSDCEVSLSDSYGNTSIPLSIGTVHIDASEPILAEINPVPKKVKLDWSSYSFKASKTGTLNFNGKCKGNVDKAVTGINHIALLTNEPGIYSDCTLTLTDSANNKSQPLKISPFEVFGNS